MTIAGWVPWLLDTLDPDGHPLLPGDPFDDDPLVEDPTVFDNYVGAHSVLLARWEVKRRNPPRWRPWLPPRPLRRACPACAAADPDAGTTLFSQLPIMIGCPVHACRLEPALDVRLATLAGEDLPLTPVPPHVAALDRRTHEGLSTGQVTLPRRAVHVGVWFRLLRTLLEELTAPLSQVRGGSARALRLIWASAERPDRAGLNGRRPYEQLDWARQQMMLEAAAAAVHLIETGAVTAHGTLGELLTVEPHRPVPPGRPRGPAEASDHAHPDDEYTLVDELWRQAMDQVAALIKTATTDPKTAREFLALLTFPAKTVEFFNRQRDNLIATGIPEQFLPDHHELGLTLV